MKRLLSLSLFLCISGTCFGASAAVPSPQRPLLGNGNYAKYDDFDAKSVAPSIVGSVYGDECVALLCDFRKRRGGQLTEPTIKCFEDWRKGSKEWKDDESWLVLLMDNQGLKVLPSELLEHIGLDLYWLNLSFNPSIESQLKIPSKCEYIQFLELHNCNLDDEKMPDLSSLSQLQVLNVEYNKLKKISEKLPKGLEDLGVAGNTEMDSFIGVLELLPNITRISKKDTPFERSAKVSSFCDRRGITCVSVFYNKKTGISIHSNNSGDVRRDSPSKVLLAKLGARNMSPEDKVVVEKKLFKSPSPSRVKTQGVGSVQEDNSSKQSCCIIS